MSAVSHRIAGLAALRSRLASLPAAARAAALPALASVAEGVAADARSALEREPGSASPGAPPHDPDGALAAAVAVTTRADGAAVTVASPAARFLEYGTARMAARPFLRPAASKAAGAARQSLAAALRRGLAP